MKFPLIASLFAIALASCGAAPAYADGGTKFTVADKIGVADKVCPAGHRLAVIEAAAAQVIKADPSARSESSPHQRQRQADCLHERPATR